MRGRRDDRRILKLLSLEPEFGTQREKCDYRSSIWALVTFHVYLASTIGKLVLISIFPFHICGAIINA